VEAAVHEYLLNQSKKYCEFYRFQVYMNTSIDMASTKPDDINSLIKYGKDLA
jgi:hypothetical protein